MKTAVRTMRAFALALALVAGGTMPSGCGKSTYLEVDFKGAGLAPVRQINLTLKRTSDSFYSAGVLPDGVDGAATGTIKFPVSASFRLNDLSDGTSLTVAADAISPDNAVVAHAEVLTTVMHAKTWTVTLDFAAGLVGGPDGGAPADAAPEDTAAPLDAADDGRSFVRITDGSIAEGGTGCVTATLEASESVSVDYDTSGSNMDAGNLLWATTGPQERFIGWMKFGLKFVPNSAKVTKATLNLSLSQMSAGLTPQLRIRSSVSDGWTRKSAAADNVSIDDKMSETTTLPPVPLPAVNPFILDVKTHDWAADIVDGTITLGVENVTVLAGAVTSSKVDFYGVPALASGPTMNRPTLDLEFCR